MNKKIILNTFLIGTSFLSSFQLNIKHKSEVTNTISNNNTFEKTFDKPTYLQVPQKSTIISKSNFNNGDNHKKSVVSQAVGMDALNLFTYTLYIFSSVVFLFGTMLGIMMMSQEVKETSKLMFAAKTLGGGVLIGGMISFVFGGEITLAFGSIQAATFIHTAFNC